MRLRASILPLGLSAAFVISLAANAQSRAALKLHYGDAIGEVYRASNGIVLIAYPDSHGNICRERIQSENGRPMTDQDVNTVLDEIAPKSDRGAYKIGGFRNMTGLRDHEDYSGSVEEYEKLVITRTGNANEYRYVDVFYLSSGCEHFESGKKRGPP